MQASFFSPQRLPKLFCLFLIVFFAAFHRDAAAEPISKFLWVECEGTNRTLDSVANVDAMLRDAKAWGMNAIFVQIYRGDRAWFDSDICDAAPYAAFRKKERKDMLQYVLDSAHKQGIKVYAWFNTFRIGKDPKARVLRKLGRDAVTRDNKGRSLLDYPKLQLPGNENTYYEADGTGYWLEPGDPGVQDYLLSLIRELTSKYPELDGVQLDFIRLPYVVPFSPGARFPKGITYGYGKRSVERFRAATKWDPLHWDGSTASAMAWDDWRRNQITEFVRKVRKEVRKRLPQGTLSAAVLCWGDRAYLTAYQDWRSWLTDGDVDFVGLMNYSMEIKFFSQLTRSAMAFADKGQIWVGLGPYLLEKREPVFKGQIEDTLKQLRENQKGGIGFFSYDSLLLAKNLVQIMKKEMASE